MVLGQNQVVGWTTSLVQEKKKKWVKGIVVEH